MKILLIEDDKKTAGFIIKGLQQAGYVVEHASDGIDGLFKATTENYDIAIIDIMLPKLDGFSIIDKLRQEKITTPIIVLSAKSSVDDRIKGLQKGCDDYLVKPFAFSELLARIQALIRRATNSHWNCDSNWRIHQNSQVVHRQHQVRPAEFRALIGQPQLTQPGLPVCRLRKNGLFIRIFGGRLVNLLPAIMT